MADVVVVGGGVGGMAAALRLGATGHQVTLVERNAELGGKLARRAIDGFTFDTGPSVLTLHAVYRDLFMKTGQPLEEVVDLVEVDPAWRYGFPDGSGDTTWLDLPNASRARLRKAFDDSLGAGTGAP